MELSQYVLEALPCSPSVLLLAPASVQPELETLRKIEHEYSLRDELDSAWAVRPLALSEHRGQTTLVLEDLGGEPLESIPTRADADAAVLTLRRRLEEYGPKRAQMMPGILLQRPRHLLIRFLQLAAKCAAAVIVTLFICFDGSAQTTGSVVGEVTDPSGAVVPGVAIKATNQSTSFSREATTDTSREYLISLLPVGRYTITAQKQGFEPFTLGCRRQRKRKPSRRRAPQFGTGVAIHFRQYQCGRS